MHNILSYLLLVAGLATALVIGFQLPLTDMPVMQGLFGTAPIGLREWGMLLLVAVNYMTPEFLSMSFGLTAGEALAEIRRQGRAVETVYVPSRGPS